LEALSYIQKEGYANWSYTIIGDGPEEKRLKKISKELGIEDKVHFAGRLSREKVFEQLKQHNIFVMPSYPETFGLAYLEAMAAGCIVIGTKGWGIDGIVKDGENGFLYNPKTKTNITNIIRYLMNTTIKDFKKIQLNSIRTSVSFEEQKKADEYLEHLKEVVIQQ
jgi:glycosyltransferase involved in cell wall biosynthesis